MSADASKERYFYGVGRRKSSTARSKFFPSNEPIEILVNGKKVHQYFPDFFVKTITNALTDVGVTSGKFLLFIKGGGLSGQAQAARLAIAKSLVTFDENLRTVLRMHGYLTTDIRKVLPKRTGLRKNRKREQWSKR